VYGFCVNQLGSREEAEDATQSTFLNAHRALQRGVTPEAELAWLFKIAHNVCLTRRRSSHRRGRVESPSDLGAVQDVLPSPRRDTSDELIRLNDALTDMPENQRRAILLREWQGLSYHEIAAELELSQSAVETLIFRARRSLAAKLDAEPEKPRLVARLAKASDAGFLVAALKGVFASATVVKAAAAVAIVTGAAVVASAPQSTQRQAAPDEAPAVAKSVARDSVAPPRALVRSPERASSAGTAQAQPTKRVRAVHTKPARARGASAAHAQHAKAAQAKHVTVARVRPAKSVAHAPKAVKPVRRASHPRPAAHAPKPRAPKATARPRAIAPAAAAHGNGNANAAAAKDKASGK